jgi:hypothetical protein
MSPQFSSSLLIPFDADVCACTYFVKQSFDVFLVAARVFLL